MIPNKDQAVVQPIVETAETESDGLITPESNQPAEKPLTAFVKYLHPEEGWLKIGDEVLLSKFAGKELPGSEDLLLVSVSECLVILNRSE